MKLIVISLIAIIALNRSSATQDDYLKWVDYNPNDDIPENAVILNKNSNKTLYVGRVYAEHYDPEKDILKRALAWIPTSIQKGQSTFDLLLFGNYYSVTEGVQILTTIRDTKVEWVETDYIHFPKLFDTEDIKPVKTGWEMDGLEFNSTVHIGKNKENIGKIFTIAVLYANNNVLYYLDENKSPAEVNNYSALIYHLD